MTKAQQHIIHNYNRSTAYSLQDVYTNYSVYKARAEKEIKQEMIDNNGWGYKILGANCMQLSCAYLKTNKENGQIEIVYHTAQNKRIFDYVA
jgi:hypothetical protein